MQSLDLFQFNRHANSFGAFMTLLDKKLFLFDIDGTISVGDTLFDGTLDLLHYIDSIGGKAYFITNNSTKSTSSYIEKFAKWNIPTTANQFMTAGYVSMKYLQNNFGKGKIYVVGTKSYIKELRANGLNITEEADDDVVAVMIAFDDEVTYDKLYKACKLLSEKDIPYIGTNPDLCCPAPFGFVPDCGSICAMVDNSVGRKPLYIGKPNRLMVDLCVQDSGFSYDETVVVGDRLYTDIAVGINAGVETIAVLTGETTQEEIDETTSFYPSYVFKDVKWLTYCLEKKLVDRTLIL